MIGPVQEAGEIRLSVPDRRHLCGHGATWTRELVEHGPIATSEAVARRGQET
jgi:hypothetical protein